MLQVSLSSYALAGAAVFRMLARAAAGWILAQVVLSDCLCVLRLDQLQKCRISWVRAALTHSCGTCFIGCTCCDVPVMECLS